jgi:DNA-directed RNA polymerase specialized sigma24 family protein
MNERVPRRVPEEKAATPDQIRAAIESLTEADFERLDEFAKNRVRRLGPKAAGITARELLNEAVVSILDGTRRWNPEKVDLPGLLIGAMRSISSNWARKYDPDEEPVLESDLKRPGSDAEAGTTVFDTAESKEPNPEQVLLASEPSREQLLIERIEQLFTDDPDANWVLECWADGMDGPAIKQLLDWTETQLNTTVRRIRRKIRAKGITGESYVQ